MEAENTIIRGETTLIRRQHTVISEFSGGDGSGKWGGYGGAGDNDVVAGKCAGAGRNRLSYMCE